jgi:hypothetical protein
LLLYAHSVAAQAARARLTGTIDRLDGQTLIVKSTEGSSVSVILPDTLAITALVNRSIADIKPGDFVGCAAVADANGKLHAQEVHIFPDSMRGVGEGHWPMDMPQQSMTNATVAQVIGAPDGQTLKLKYPGGEQEIEVAPTARIVGIVVGDRSLLRPGAAVLIVANKAEDGTLSARFLQVEKDGVKP